MKAKNSDWYKHGWSLDVKNQSWTEDTENQVNFIIRTLQLKGNERILDLACGYGRHALSFAKRGFWVVGVDITKIYIEDAAQTAKENGLNAQFIQEDIRNLSYKNEFDVVLNLADGAVGYLENDAENLKIFDTISNALKVGGKHFMDICNAEHAELYFPRANWEAGKEALALSQFDWDPASRRMLFGGCDIPYGAPLSKPDIPAGDPTRLYSAKEIAEIFSARSMKVESTFSDYYGTESSSKFLQLLVVSTKI
ncbi:MAG: class I SAM-dependent methyltransferase [Oscillospiraceae bacterium]|nr:class I SAM-dependent methyltransferase [Oscillospiraceae bacterium]